MSSERHQTLKLKVKRIKRFQKVHGRSLRESMNVGESRGKGVLIKMD